MQVEDKAVMYEVSDLLQQISLMEAAGDASPRHGGLFGNITYISGAASTFCIDDNLWIDGIPYSKQQCFYPFMRIKSLLRRQIYTLDNLTMFIGQSTLTSFQNGKAVVLEPERRKELSAMLRGLPLIKGSENIASAEDKKGTAKWQLLFSNGSNSAALFGFESGLIEISDISGGKGIVLYINDSALLCGKFLGK
jgi:hypothetical protein